MPQYDVMNTEWATDEGHGSSITSAIKYINRLLGHAVDDL